ncbi:MAG: aspartate/glutamate racemase family protein [Elusimicrobia bacterium]|nr:aspartate/glutamate racemase family protein [Elusimicrobiota bacterium]
MYHIRITMSTFRHRRDKTFAKIGLMKTIGLLGGLTWESSMEYYRIINERVREKLGGFHSAKTVMYSVDFSEIEYLAHRDKWKEIAEIAVSAAKNIEKGGADFLVICANTLHKLDKEIQEGVNIPILHIVDATAKKIQRAGYKKVGLLGTRFTMEEDYYKNRMSKNFSMEIIVPDKSQRQIVDDVIFKELAAGIRSQDSRDKFKLIIDDLAKQGAQAVILGCTEIPLLISQKDTPKTSFGYVAFIEGSR